MNAFKIKHQICIINPRFFPVFPNNFLSLASDEHLIIITWLVTVSLKAAPLNVL
jgi:hypothetical protein